MMKTIIDLRAAKAVPPAAGLASAGR